MKTLIYCLVLSGLIYAQNTYNIPYNETDLIINLKMKTRESTDYTKISGGITQKPEWLDLEYSNIHDDNFTFKFKVNSATSCDSILSIQVSNDNKLWNKVFFIHKSLPSTFLVEQNYPNPFNSSTVVKYFVPKESNVKIYIYNILGEQLYFKEEMKKSGLNEFMLNLNNLSSGVYFYSIEAKSNDGSFYTSSKKMTLIK